MASRVRSLVTHFDRSVQASTQFFLVLEEKLSSRRLSFFLVFVCLISTLPMPGLGYRKTPSWEPPSLSPNRPSLSHREFQRCWERRVRLTKDIVVFGKTFLDVTRQPIPDIRKSLCSSACFFAIPAKKITNERYLVVGSFRVEEKLSTSPVIVLHAWLASIHSSCDKETSSLKV